MWRRDEDLRIESAVDAERFIEEVGFANTLTDARRTGPSLYIAVCGRRDVSLPRNIQKDEETRLAWHLKDEVMRRGRVYYAKLAGGRSMFVAPALISHFAAIWMPRRKDKYYQPQPSGFSKCSGANMNWPRATCARKAESPNVRHSHAPSMSYNAR